MSEVGEKDRGQLMGIFSAEVWLHILGNVKDASDFQRISSASPYLGTLLQPRATQVLFPEVLQIILRKHPQLLAPKELLPLRQVCHAWKFGVEHALHDPQHMFLSRDEQRQREDLTKKQCWHNFRPNILCTHERFDCGVNFSRFHQHFGATHQADARSNPFFCHVIELNVPREPRHFEECVQFLESYGVAVRSCSISQGFLDDEQRVQFYGTYLPQILALLPNLKVCGFVGCSSMPNSFLLQRAVDESLVPMPELRHLQKIRVNGLALPFLRAVVQKNPQVSIAQ